MDPPAATTTTAKLRLMCSYGGQIIPRPHNTNSLYYAGGDTRIITIPTTTPTTTISSFTANISTALNHTPPFTLKYQLPNHDLDSLITLSSDDDLHIMLDEHHRLCHHQHSRIRLFLFPPKLNNNSVLLYHPRTEAWFVDALKSAKIMESGREVVVQSEGDLQESMVLETSSSFGSTSSSVSLSSLPPIKVEDSVVCLEDSKVKLSSPESIVSDNSVASAITHPQTGMYQDQVVPVENNVSSNPFESESKSLDPPSGVQMHRTIQVSGYPLTPQMDHPQRQQLQFVQLGSHYVTHNPNGVFPVTSYYPMYNPPLHQHQHLQQQLYYQSNQPYPIYILPVGQTQPYNVPMQCSLIDPAIITPNRPPVHPSTALIPPQVAYKEVTVAPPVPELASQVYRTGPAPAANPLVPVPYNENQHQSMGLPQMHHQPQSIGVASRETANYGIELDDDPIRAQIYKSQPAPPTLPSQYQTMTKATTVLLSEALEQLHTDNVKQQQIRTSQPQ